LRNARHEIRFKNSIRRVMHAVALVQNYCSACIYHSVYIFMFPSHVSCCFCFWFCDDARRCAAVPAPRQLLPPHSIPQTGLTMHHDRAPTDAQRIQHIQTPTAPRSAARLPFAAAEE
jgi:hypothetical protein